VTEELKFEVDLDLLELDDLEILDMSKEGATMREYLDVLDRIVAGGVRGKGYKVTDMRQMGDAILAATRDAANPEDAKGKN
jgi:hypothetical protein